MTGGYIQANIDVEALQSKASDRFICRWVQVLIIDHKRIQCHQSMLVINEHHRGERLCRRPKIRMASLGAGRSRRSFRRTRWLAMEAIPAQVCHQQLLKHICRSPDPMSAEIPILELWLLGYRNQG
jgi:hypothetical protein